MFGMGRGQCTSIGVRAAIAGACLVAALSLSMIAVASASAAPPEIGRCVKVKLKGTGRYNDAGCEKGEVKPGNYEWEPGCVHCGFTSTEGKSTFETPKKEKIVCLSDTDTGRYLPPKEDEETVRFAGCELVVVGAKIPCQNRGPGEIETNPLRSVLGFIKKPAITEVGMSLEGAGGLPYAEFNCGGLTVVITGSVIAKVTPISKMTTLFKEIFKAKSGKQVPENFEGEPKDTLTCSVYENKVLLKSEGCGFTSTDTVTNEEKLEVNEVL